MNFFETIGNCLNDTVQTLVEKNRVKAQVNRLRLVMRSEAKSINKAYIELGKEYYKKIKDGELSPSAEADNHCNSIVKSGERFKKAVARYHELMDKQLIDADTDIDTDDEDDAEDITLCCSYEESSTVDKLDECHCNECSEEGEDEESFDELQSVKDKVDEMIGGTNKTEE